jgi:V/A-type H+-transporting ATPase subunit I
MIRARIAGPKSAASRVISTIYKLGFFHLTIPREDPLLARSKALAVLSMENENAKLRLIESLIGNIAEALSHLPSAKSASVPVESAIENDDDKWLAEAEFGELGKVSREILEMARGLPALEAEIKEVRLYHGVFEEFQPLLAKAGAFRGMEISGVTLAVGYADVFEEMKKTLDEVTSGACAVFKGKEEERGLAALLLYPASFSDEVKRRVFGNKVRPIKPPEKYERGSFASTLKALFMREREIESEIKRIQARLDELAESWRDGLAMAAGALSRLMEPLKAQGSIAGSQMSFWLSGWIPEADLPQLKKILDEEFGGAALVYSQKPAREEFPATPVKLSNRRWARPFEQLIRLYSPPMYGTVDPTALLAVTGPLLFGLMLGDIGYAILLAVFARGGRRFMPRNDLAGDLSSIAINCAVWTAFFGVVFGEFFGGVSAWTPLIHRKDDAITFLVMMVTLGGAHLCLGSLVGFYSEMRLGATRKAVEKLADCGFIASLFIAGWSVLSGYGGPLILLPLAPLAVRIASAGVSEGGLEAPRILSNILSYSRLMAIGLSSVILADLARDIYGASEVALIGTAGAVSIHAVNFVMGVYAPAIQAARLHYVEFFGRFYDAGGVSYSPLKLN